MNPKAILFDYGMTLCTETEYGVEAGWEAVLARAHNPRGVTPAQMTELMEASLRELGLSRPEWDKPMELYFPSLMRYLLERCDILLDCTDEEAEQILWDAGFPAQAAPHIGEVLRALDARGVRTGVVSNMWYTRATLERRLHALLPEGRFRFVIASSACAFRKPNRRIFELALHKIGAAPEETWFCGDNAACDVEGSSAVGMRPFWYRVNGDFDALPRPRCAFTPLSDWRALLDYLD